MKIYKYELRRLLCNKFFVGLLVITMFYSYQVMDGEIVLGVANTAPFSGWSYGAFLSDILPLLLITLLFFITFLYSPNEKKVQTITDTTPMDPTKYRLIRCFAMITGFVISDVAAIAVSLVFYGRIFHFTGFGGFVAPTLVALLPALLFILGIGMIAGKLHPVSVYALIPVVLLLALVPLPDAADLFCGSFFSNYPATLGVVEPAFSVPVFVMTGRCAYALVGLALIAAAVVKKPKHN